MAYIAFCHKTLHLEMSNNHALLHWFIQDSSVKYCSKLEHALTRQNELLWYLERKYIDHSIEWKFTQKIKSFTPEKKNNFCRLYLEKRKAFRKKIPKDWIKKLILSRCMHKNTLCAAQLFIGL